MLAVWGLTSLGFLVGAFATGVLPQPAAAAVTVAPVAIDLNLAPVPQLQALPGIGPRRAEAIVLERVRHGPFRSLADLARVDGIGPSVIEALHGIAVCDGRVAVQPR